MATIFEKTMEACLESKKPATKKGLKRNPKSVMEAKSRKRIHESDDLEDDTPVYDTPEFVDDVVVVTDPEMTADDVASAGEEAQDIIDNTPDGEQPMTTEHVGDYTYTCPICGNTFFSENEMHEGDACPVCGDTPEDFVLVGSVASPEEVEGDAEGNDNATDDLDFDADEGMEEARKVARRKRNERKCSAESRRHVRKGMRREARRPMRRPMKKESALRIDETTFNPYLTKFVRENFKNTRSFNLVGAKKRGNRLTLECKLTFKSGKSKKVNLKVENFRAGMTKMAAREDGTFKTESRRGGKAPFVFMTRTKNGVITCEGLHYDMIARLKEKRARVYGKIMKESRKPVSRRPMRKPMRRPVRK